MPKVIILPHYHYENDFVNFLGEANKAQKDFKFYLLPPEKGNESPLGKPSADCLEILGFLDSRKRQMDCKKEDLLIAFYDGVLTNLTKRLTNLFIAGRNTEDSYPCTAAVSLKFISWGILEQKYDYSLQRHALFHLVMCSLIFGYTKVTTHYETYGCLLDFCNQLVDFNRRLQRGYYLCSPSQGGCYNAVQSEPYGNSIIRLCEVLREGALKAREKNSKMIEIVEQLAMRPIQHSIHVTAHVTAKAESDSMSEASQSKYNLSQAKIKQIGNLGDEGNVGNVVDQAKSRSNIESVGTEHNYASEQKQSLADAAAEIQQLLDQLSQTTPTTTEIEKLTVVAKAAEKIKGNPTLKLRVINALKAGGTEVFKEAIDHPLINILVATIEGWKNAEE